MRGTAYLISSLTTLSCRKPYNPPAIISPGNYLVVEGVINPGSDSTTIMLSRTVNLSSQVTANPVSDALVSVQSEQGASFPLTEAGNGKYVSPGLNLDFTQQYRLSIKTSNSEQYYSDYVPATATPPMDSVGFNIVKDPETGVEIYANTHDPTNNIHYFRWDYTENWQFNAKFLSQFMWNGSAFVVRQQQVYFCYTGDVSSDIVLATSAKLQQDVIYQAPIVFIASTSEKIENEYSILLNQYALTPDAYIFWSNLKTNTEQLGSIFDAQPSQLIGNIHCITHSAEPVIGYVSVSTVSTKRIFIYYNQLPGWVTTYPYTCNQDTAKIGSFPFLNLELYPQVVIPTSQLMAPGTTAGYLFTTVPCGDCTIRGSLTPPIFWQ